MGQVCIGDEGIGRGRRGGGEGVSDSATGKGHASLTCTSLITGMRHVERNVSLPN